jgi:hypothetical protein
LRNRTQDVMGQIEYDSILPFPHLGNKDRSPEDRTVRDRANSPKWLLHIRYLVSSAHFTSVATLFRQGSAIFQI